MTLTAIDPAARRRHTVLVVYRGVSDVAAKGAMLIVTIAAARRLSREEFGVFALASTLGWLGSVAADFGIQVHVARAVSQHPDVGRSLLRRWLPVRIATGLTALVVSWAAMMALGMAPSTALPMMLFMLAYGAGGLTDCFYYFFRGIDRTDLESTFTLAQRGLMFALALAVLWRRPDVTLLGEAMLASAVLTLVAAGVVAWRLAAGADGRNQLPGAGIRREFIESVAPIGVGVLLSALYFRIDVFLLERWSGTTAVALYNAVFRIVDALRLFPGAVLAVALPVLCRAGDLRPVARLAAPLTAAACGTSAVLWISAGWLVPAVYGAPYADAVRPFRTLVLAFPLMALNYALTQQLIGWHGQRAYAIVCAGALAFNLLLNWQLIPALGMNGAAWSTLWTEAFLTVGCGLALTRAIPAAAPFAMQGHVSLEDRA